MAHFSAGSSIEDVHTVKMLGVNRQTSLHFKDIKSTTHRNDYIAFIAVGIAPEEKFPQQKAMAVLLLHFSNHHIFKQQPSQLQICIHAANAQQKGQQPGVVEIELGRLDDTLVEILKIRRQLENNVTALQNGKPLPCNMQRDACFVGQIGIIEQPPRSASTQGKKISE